MEPNGGEAEKWLRLAAEQGHSGAAALLASSREPGLPEGALDEETLPDWCVAAEDGNAQAQYEVAAYFLDHPDSAWQEDVERYLEMAVEQGHPQACLRLGMKLLEAHPQQALVHLRNAADCGVPRAMELLGECCARGEGVGQDPEQAEAWFIAAARRGGGEDMLKLAIRYRRGDGVPRSPGRSMSWFRQAQQAGVADAEARYYGEEWAARKEREAQQAREARLAPLRARAEAGDPQAQNELGQQYARWNETAPDWP